MDPRIPPHDEQIESSIIGGILIDRDAIVEVAEFLRPEHFYKPIHLQIYQAMLNLYERRDPIDLVTLTAELKKQKQLAKVGGSIYLTSLTEAVPTAANIERYGHLVKDLWLKRTLINKVGKLAEMGFDDGIEAKDLMDHAEQEIFSLSQVNLARSFISMKKALEESFDRLDELHKSAGGLRGIPSGFTDLDEALAGMQNSNLIILAARPGIGKTSFALNIARYVAVERQLPVGYFSLEMSSEELVDRVLVRQANIDAWKLKTGKLDEKDFTNLSDAMGELAEAPLFIDDTPGISIMEMRTKARRLMVEHGLKLIVVDYLQLARPSRRVESRVQEVTEISQGLKNLARELKIPVLALSQLSRQVEHRGTKKPMLADLRESGALEQDADVVMFLWRDDEEVLENVTLSVEKHRNGPLRTLQLFFKGNLISFFGVEKKRKTT
jgi:replicative DNA helicase